VTDEGEPASGATGGLTEFQIEVAHVFFDLPSSSGFLLAGGAALLAQQLTDRPTHDLDLFTSPGRGDVMMVVVEFEVAAGARSSRRCSVPSPALATERFHCRATVSTSSGPSSRPGASS
jgi:hypothetical protein